MKHVRSPWIPVGLLVSISAAAYIERDGLTVRDKFVFTTIFVLLSVYIVEALTKRKH